MYNDWEEKYEKKQKELTEVKEEHEKLLEKYEKEKKEWRVVEEKKDELENEAKKLEKKLTNAKEDGEEVEKKLTRDNEYKDYIAPTDLEARARGKGMVSQEEYNKRPNITLDDWENNWKPKKTFNWLQ